MKPHHSEPHYYQNFLSYFRVLTLFSFSPNLKVQHKNKLYCVSSNKIYTHLLNVQNSPHKANELDKRSISGLKQFLSLRA